MIRSASSSLSRSVRAPIRRGFSSSGDKEEKIVSAVLLERLPVVIPKIDPAIYAFNEFS
jgi:large subunit ribosomal protein L46